MAQSNIYMSNNNEGKKVSRQLKIESKFIEVLIKLKIFTQFLIVLNKCFNLHGQLSLLLKRGIAKSDNLGSI